MKETVKHVGGSDGSEYRVILYCEVPYKEVQ